LKEAFFCICQKTTNQTVQFCGLLSDGGVHSHTSQPQRPINRSERIISDKGLFMPLQTVRDVTLRVGKEYLKKIFIEFCASIKKQNFSYRYWALLCDG